MSEVLEFGRVDEELNVFVNDGGTERRIGQMPGANPADAIEFYSRKYADLAAQVRLVEQRVAAGADVASIAKTVERLQQDLVEPAALGDLAALRERLSTLEPKLTELREKKKEANRESIAAALAAREEVVVAAESLAEPKDKRVWKTDSAKMTELFERWQALQKTSIKVPKDEADKLWKRFSNARKNFDNQKRGFFASQDQLSKDAKARKQELIQKAETLANSPKPSVLEYRKLLDAWKASGRVAGKAEDTLWASFKAAGDKIYAARAVEVAEQSASQAEALSAKLALLEEAKAIDPKKDLAAAKRLLADIQKRWASAGRVSKDALRDTEDKLRAIEKSVKDVEQEQWRKSDPAAQERANSVLSQLESSISALQSELEAAKAGGNSKKIADAEAALATRTAWLEAVKAANA
jgi:Domain of Unknown Function (DUF349)